MAINSVHNRIAFPRLANNQTSMLMGMPAEKKEEKTLPVIVEPDLPPPPSRDKQNRAKYYLGAASLASSTIAGIYH